MIGSCECESCIKMKLCGKWACDSPIYDKKGKLVGNAKITRTGYRIVELYREYCDEQAVVTGRPKLTDIEVVEEYIVVNWAYQVPINSGEKL